MYQLTMSLFCVNGQRLKFDIVGLNDVVVSREIKRIILENGGMIEHNDNQIIKFTANKKFVTYAYPSYKLYNITFIQDCAKNNTIVDPSPYRIGTPMLYDDCLMKHFLNKCSCCAKSMDFAETKNNDSRNSYNSPTDEQKISRTDRATNFAESENNDSSNSNDSATNEKQVPEIESDGSDDRVNKPSLHGQSRSRSTEHHNSSNKNDESDESSFQTTEHERDQGPENRMRSSKSRKNRTIRYKRGRGQKFTSAERRAIVKFLVDNKVINQVDKGLRVWSFLIANGICSNRTPNSVYRHFRRYILPSIESYKLTEKQLQRFKKLFQPT